MPSIIPEQLESFLAYVRERRLIQQRREAGAPFPWTDDPVLRSKKFCCVLRDDDRTSREAKAIILALPAEQRLGAALGFRLYNRVSTLEALRDRGVLLSGSGDEAWKLFQELPAVVSTAYKISVKGGLFNIKTIASMVGLAVRRAKTFDPRRRAELTCLVIRGALDCGPFIAYQTVQDLRWVLGPFEDEHTWCVLGPGALRGCMRLCGVYDVKQTSAAYAGGDKVERTGTLADSAGLATMGFSTSGKEMVLHPTASKFLSQLQPTFQQTCGGNMFELEHNLCEYDKLVRIRTKEAPGTSWKPKP